MADTKKKRSSREIASEALAQFEGYKPGVYKDIKGIDTAGYGFNLDAPETKGMMKSYGYDPEDVRSGRVEIPEDVAKQIKEQLIDINQREIEKQFGNLGLSNNEIAALTTLRYNSPSLIGPNLTKYLNEGDKVNAAKEIMVRSNKENNAGLARRRLEEAKMFTGGVLPDLTPEETMDLRSIFNDRPDTFEKRKLLNDFPMLNPAQDKSGHPFFKIKKNLYSPMKEEYEASKSEPYVSIPPVETFGDQFSSPDDGTIPAVTDVTNILDQYDLLKRLK
jgi:GH24 family phage-related lysozyme (muramidase)